MITVTEGHVYVIFYVLTGVAFAPFLLLPGLLGLSVQINEVLALLGQLKIVILDSFI
jgi:hypothetical protein